MPIRRNARPLASPARSGTAARNISSADCVGLSRRRAAGDRAERGGLELESDAAAGEPGLAFLTRTTLIDWISRKDECHLAGLVRDPMGNRMR